MSSQNFIISPEISRARDLGLPIVVLESTVITHGLPIPQNMELARNMEAKVREQGAIPATVALLGGKIRVGISDKELEKLANAEDPVKVSRRDFAKAHWDLGIKSAILVTNPIPEDFSLDDDFINPIIAQASQDAQDRSIQGQALTPFLLARINKLSKGRSLKSNLVLLHNNATLAAKIAKVMTKREGRKNI